MAGVIPTPLISVVIPTRDRAPFLDPALRSLTEQSMSPDHFEILVIDDGSVDGTPDVCRQFSAEMRLRYFRLPRVGLSSAKNLGIFASSGDLTLFFDDDDIAHPDMLKEHMRAHQKHPEEYLAVLGCTDWAPGLPITEVMHYLTNVGQNLFSFRSFRDGEILGFTKFWGGRTSCKRTFLVRCGVFDQRMPCLEDIELGFRLGRHGLKVLFHRSAMSYMIRPVTYDDFCRRCERQGVCRVHFIRLHPDPRLLDPLGMANAAERWQRMRPLLDGQVRRVHELQAMLEAQPGEEEKTKIRDELYYLYKATFAAFYLKGTAESLESSEAVMLQDGRS